jgi:NAD(P)-dependent dehydrogenase (short-subunit alcohol dehydrogenase family)
MYSSEMDSYFSAPGLGREWAVQSAREGARCISLIGRDKVQLQATLEEVQRVAPEAVVSAFTADVTNEDGILQAIREAEAVAGTIDILIANAGTLEVCRFCLEGWSGVCMTGPCLSTSTWLQNHRSLQSLLSVGRKPPSERKDMLELPVDCLAETAAAT